MLCILVGRSSLYFPRNQLRHLALVQFCRNQRWPMQYMPLHPTLQSYNTQRYWRRHFNDLRSPCSCCLGRYLHLRNTQALECLILNPFLRNSKQYVSLIGRGKYLILGFVWHPSRESPSAYMWSLAPLRIRGRTLLVVNVYAQAPTGRPTTLAETVWRSIHASCVIVILCRQIKFFSFLFFLYTFSAK